MQLSKVEFLILLSSFQFAISRSIQSKPTTNSENDSILSRNPRLFHSKYHENTLYGQNNEDLADYQKPNLYARETNAIVNPTTYEAHQLYPRTGTVVVMSYPAARKIATMFQIMHREPDLHDPDNAWMKKWPTLFWPPQPAIDIEPHTFKRVEMTFEGAEKIAAMYAAQYIQPDMNDPKNRWMHQFPTVFHENMHKFYKEPPGTHEESQNPQPHEGSQNPQPHEGSQKPETHEESQKPGTHEKSQKAQTHSRSHGTYPQAYPDNHGEHDLGRRGQTNPRKPPGVKSTGSVGYPYSGNPQVPKTGPFTKQSGTSGFYPKAGTKQDRKGPSGPQSYEKQHETVDRPLHHSSGKWNQRFNTLAADSKHNGNKLGSSPTDGNQQSDWGPVYEHELFQNYLSDQSKSDTSLPDLPAPQSSDMPAPFRYTKQPPTDQGDTSSDSDMPPGPRLPPTDQDTTPSPDMELPASPYYRKQNPGQKGNTPSPPISPEASASNKNPNLQARNRPLSYPGLQSSHRSSRGNRNSKEVDGQNPNLVFNTAGKNIPPVEPSYDASTKYSTTKLPPNPKKMANTNLDDSIEDQQDVEQGTYDDLSFPEDSVQKQEAASDQIPVVQGAGSGVPTKLRAGLKGSGAGQQGPIDGWSKYQKPKAKTNDNVRNPFTTNRNRNPRTYPRAYDAHFYPRNNNPTKSADKQAPGSTLQPKPFSPAYENLLAIQQKDLAHRQKGNAKMAKPELTTRPPQPKTTVPENLRMAGQSQPAVPSVYPMHPKTNKEPNADEGFGESPSDSEYGDPESRNNDWYKYNPLPMV